MRSSSHAPSGNGRNTRNAGLGGAYNDGCCLHDGCCLLRWVLPSAADWILASCSSVHVKRVIPRAKSRQPISAARAAPSAASRADSVRSARKIVFYLARPVLVLLATFFALAPNRQKGKEIARKRHPNGENWACPCVLTVSQSAAGVHRRGSETARSRRPRQARAGERCAATRLKSHCWSPSHSRPPP